MVANLEFNPWIALYALAGCLCAAAAMMPVMALGSWNQARVLKRSAFDRLGGNLLRVGLACGVPGCAILGGLLYPSTIAYGLFGLAVLLLILYGCARSGKAEKVVALAAAAVAWLAALCLLILLAAGASGRFFLEAELKPELILIGLEGALRSAPAAASCLFAGFVFWGLAAGGAFTLIYLLFRRSIDNYGRDYYQLTAAWAASKAAWGAVLLFIGLCGAVAVGLPFEQLAETLLPWLAMAGASSGLAFCCWMAVSRHDYPMRLKFLMVLGAVLLLVFSYAVTEAVTRWPL